MANLVKSNITVGQLLELSVLALISECYVVLLTRALHWTAKIYRRRANFFNSTPKKIYYF